MDASNRMLLATILLAGALVFVGLVFAYPAYYAFLPRRLALATRIVFLILAAGLTANAIFSIRGGVPGIGLSMVTLLGVVMIFVHRPWTVRYYREERDRELEQLRLLGPHLLGLDDRSRKP